MIRVLMEFAAVAERDDAAAVRDVDRTLHDRLLETAGPFRRSGVRWQHFDATSDHAKSWLRENLAPGTDLDGLIHFLDANPQGLLVVASCEHEEMA